MQTTPEKYIMPATIIYLTIALSFICVAHGFGKELIHSAGAQESLPTNSADAYAAGWIQSYDSCIPSLGTGWNKEFPYPSKAFPITLYFAANGQLSGFGTEILGLEPPLWNLRGYFTKEAEQLYRIKVGTRSSRSNLCTITTPFSETIGDRIVINPDGINQRIPATEKEAADQQWTRGACINGMGRHWEYDLVTAPVIVRTILNSLLVWSINSIFKSLTTFQICCRWFQCTTTMAILMRYFSFLGAYSKISATTSGVCRTKRRSTFLI
jgi:hypothetical protein